MAHQAIVEWLIALLAAQVVFLLLHDWVPLGRLSNLAAVRGIDSTPKLLLTTVLSALPWIIGLASACSALRAALWPHWLQTYLVILEGLGLLGAAIAWWIPYLVRPDPVRAARYRTRFAGTLSFLPERNGITPDTLHVVFHATLVATLLLLARL